MSKIRILVVLLLALALLVPAAGASLGVDMFSFPTLSVPSYNGESLFANSGTSSITAPTMGMIMEGSSPGQHIHPVLSEPTWTSSMKTSPINQVLTLLHFKGSKA
ncbi:MAG TPA: hypothetical protein VGK13_04890 [Methanocellaceae archaeon]